MSSNRKNSAVKGLSPSQAAPVNSESEWGAGKDDQETHGWLMMGGIMAIMLLAIGATIWLSKKNDPALEFAKPLETEMPADALEWQGPLPAQVAENFTKASTQEERLRWVRDPERVAAIMSSFFENGTGAQEKILGLRPMGPGTNGSLAFMRFQARLANGGSRLLAVVLTDEGAKVDFECYARHGSATWQDLLSGKASEASEMRGFLAKEFLYTNQFSDEKQWNCFLITSPDCEELIYAYAARGSETDKALSELGNAGDIRVTLALRSVGDSFQKRQFEVTQLVSASWVR